MTQPSRYRPSKRLRDAALVVPLGGVILFLPPYVQIFDQSGFVLGIPPLHVWLFTIWALGIVLTGLMARRLIRSEAAPNVKQDNGERRVTAKGTPGGAPGITNRPDDVPEHPAE